MRFWKTILVALAILCPGTLRAQDRVPVAPIQVREYALGYYDPQEVDSVVRLAGNRLRDTSITITIVGYADATPYTRRCVDDPDPGDCSHKWNQVLAFERATEFVKALLKHDVTVGQVVTNGIVLDSIGGKHRGVDVFFDHRRVSATPAQVAGVPEVSQASFDSLAREVARNAATTQALRDSIARLGRPVTATMETKQEGPFANVDASVGASGISGQGFTSVAPTLGVFVTPRSIPNLELSLEGGYRPSGSDEVCGRADLVGAVGATLRRRQLDPVGISVGAYTARNVCRDGPPGVNERFIKRQTGGFLGLSLLLPLGNFALHATPALTYAQADSYTGNSQRGIGFKANLGIRTIWR